MYVYTHGFWHLASGLKMMLPLDADGDPQKKPKLGDFSPVLLTFIVLVFYTISATPVAPQTVSPGLGLDLLDLFTN